ncbi:rRNA-processing protein cgr1 [Clarireedia jacksonii]
MQELFFPTIRHSPASQRHITLLNGDHTIGKSSQSKNLIAPYCVDSPSHLNISTEMAPPAVATPAQASVTPAPLGMRKNGKQWHEPKKAFRPRAGNNSYERRAKERIALAAIKAKEKEMKDEKEADRQARITKIKDKRARKEERERFEKMAQRMHQKRVDRLKRREKRNKMLKS